MNKFAMSANPNYTSTMKDEEINAILSQVAAGTMLSQDAKAQLGMTNGTFYRLMRKHDVKRPLGMQRAATQDAKTTRERRIRVAKLVIDERLHFEEALAILGVHRTTLQRIIDKVKASVK